MDAGDLYLTVRHREIGTSIPIFLHDVRGGKQVSSYFGTRTGTQTSRLEQAQIELPAA